MWLVLQVLVDVCTPEVIQTSMLPAVLKLATDPVANVRFNVAKSLTNIAQQMENRCVRVCVCVVGRGFSPSMMQVVVWVRPDLHLPVVASN